MPLTEVQDLADTRLAQKISQVPGVGLVSSRGGQRPAVRIQANPQRARRLRPQPRGPAHRDRQRQRQHAKGSFDGPTRAYTIDANDQLADRRRLQRPDRRLPQRRAGAPVRRRRRGRRRREHQARRLGERRRRRSSSTSSASPAPTSSQVVDRIKALLPQLQATLPAAVDVARADRPHRSPSAPRCTTSSSSCCSRSCWSCW